jgi:hypothetical protein
MLKSLLYFTLGYITARYIILHYGTDAYLDKERTLIGMGKEKVDDLLEDDEIQPGY